MNNKKRWLGNVCMDNRKIRRFQKELSYKNLYVIFGRMRKNYNTRTYYIMDESHYGHWFIAYKVTGGIFKDAQMDATDLNTLIRKWRMRAFI